MIKVLYLVHPEADFLDGLIYMGLREVLGADGVVDYPYKGSFHGKIDTYPSPYGRNEGTSLRHAWPQTDDGRVGTTGPFSWMPSFPGRSWPLDEVCARIGEFDLVILTSPRARASAALSEIIARVGRGAIRCLAMMDGEDYTTIRWDIVQTFQPSTYFKRERVADGGYDDIYQSQRSTATRVLPCPFACALHRWGRKEKDIDVLFLGGATWPGRAEVCEAMSGAFGSRFAGGVGVTLPPAEYYDALGRARVAVSVRGHGFDTLRFWEIPAFPDTMMVADVLPLEKPFPFVGGEHVAYFRSPGELVAVVDHYLGNEVERLRVARAGNAHLLRHHTARARATYVIEEALG